MFAKESTMNTVGAGLSEIERLVQIWSDCESEAVIGGARQPRRPKPSPEIRRAQLVEAERLVLAWSDCVDE